MNRRQFNMIMASGAVFNSLNGNMEQAINEKHHGLQAGDTVGLICPSGRITTEKYQKAIKNITGLNLKYKHSKRILDFDGYLAGTDQHRLKDLHDMYLDDTVKAIWCIRGGYGATRILDQLDFDLIKAHPKMLIGYSDITALLNTIHQQTGSPCIHGPVAASTFTDYTIQHLKPIFEPHAPHVIHPSLGNASLAKDKDVYRLEVIHPGIAQGGLVGGNLSLLTALVGTQHQVDTRDQLVFIEDIGEEPYRVDRMLTQLLSSGFFENVKGVILGVFAGCHRKDERSKTLHEVIRDRMSSLTVPTVYGYSFGHIDDQCTFPIGRTAKLDTASNTITLL